MTGLALGVPAVTSHGNLSEPIWQAERLALIAPAGDVAGHVALAERLLESPDERRELAGRAAQGYARLFSVKNTVRRLREAAGAESDSTPDRAATTAQGDLNP
jgi:hypothetical protein